MTSQMTAEEIVAALIAKGVPKERAQLVARSNAGATLTDAIKASPIAPPVALPVRITLQWSALCSDNDREVASLYMLGAKPVPRKVMTARYKAAREKVVAAARRVMLDAAPLDVPLSLTARVYVPDNRLHDCANFGKGVHDALEKIVYTNDKLLHRVLWVRAGVDVDAPRAEVEINSLANTL